MFPIDRQVLRRLPEDWVGDVFVVDIDRTYLATRFSSLGGLLRIPFEEAHDKQDLPGMARLLREIVRPGARGRPTALYFVSASPGQLRAVFRRKLRLDRIEADGTTYKDWVGVARSLRIGRYREQLGFKLTALLAGRSELPVGAREFLIGDDLESDPLAFALYADLVARRVEGRRAHEILIREGVASQDADAILELAQRCPNGGVVARGLVRLERRQAEDLRRFRGGVVPCTGAGQMAIVLADHGALGVDAAAHVIAAERGGSPGAIGAADVLADAARRGLAVPDLLQTLAGDLERRGLLPAGYTVPTPDPAWLALRQPPPTVAWLPG
jgi:hypothetical protein